jgi:hypothetical protein
LRRGFAAFLAPLEAYWRPCFLYPRISNIPTVGLSEKIPSSITVRRADPAHRQGYRQQVALLVLASFKPIP